MPVNAAWPNAGRSSRPWSSSGSSSGHEADAVWPWRSGNIKCPSTTIYKWKIENDKIELEEIKPKPLHERFGIRNDTSEEDNHFDGIDRGVPPKCGWWGFGSFDLNLYKVTFKNQEEADKYERKWGRKLKAAEAPPFVNGNPDGTTQGMEGYPTFDDVDQELLVEADGKSNYARKWEYVYLPIHIGKKDITQLSDADKRALQTAISNAKGGMPGITLDVLMTMRDLTLGMATWGAGANHGNLNSVLDQTPGIGTAVSMAPVVGNPGTPRNALLDAAGGSDLSTQLKSVVSRGEYRNGLMASGIAPGDRFLGNEDRGGESSPPGTRNGQ